jgi:hypothetical protein
MRYEIKKPFKFDFEGLFVGNGNAGRVLNPASVNVKKT